MALCLVGRISRWLAAVVARRADGARPVRAQEDGVVQREDDGKNWRPNAVRSIGSILALSWPIHCAGTRRCHPVNVDVQQTRVWPAMRLSLCISSQRICAMARIHFFRHCLRCTAVPQLRRNNSSTHAGGEHRNEPQEGRESCWWCHRGAWSTGVRAHPAQPSPCTASVRQDTAQHS
jgi:hypothetical protein